MKFDFRGFEIFEECSECIVKPGFPVLCGTCLTQRQNVGNRNYERRCKIPKCIDLRRPEHDYCEPHFWRTLVKRSG